MSVKGCCLTVSDWMISENYESKKTDLLVPEYELSLYGNVTESDENVIDDFKFIICLTPNDEASYEISVDEGRVGLSIKWPKDEIVKIEKLLLTDKVQVSFWLLMEFKERFDFRLPENTECKIISIRKSIRNIKSI